jgi:adenylylsulfate kinase
MENDDMKKSRNITWSRSFVTREDKENILGQKGALIWFTGLSASGKSAISHALENKLCASGYFAVVLDGDNIRHGLNKDLGFSPEDRDENIRRIGEVSKLFTENGVITMSAFISPYRADRDRVRANLAAGDFIEIYLKCPMDELKRRDPKGLYKKALEGSIQEFTGVSAPYEAPLSPEITLDTYETSLDECVENILDYLRSHKIINK